MELAIAVVFIIGYIFIAVEHNVHINKAASALITGVLCWTIYVVAAASILPGNEAFEASGYDFQHFIKHELAYSLSHTSEILFFLLGAMTIVELVDIHHGFAVITSKITTRDQRKLMWIICIITFFFSAILDNLTTTIVMVSLLRKLISDRETRIFFVGMVVIAANAGGAWSPMGDVTTTMLWIGGQITPLNIITKLIFPSLVCMLIPLLVLSLRFKGTIDSADLEDEEEDRQLTKKQRNTVFWCGLGALASVPVFKTVTHLPPYMGMLLGLGFMWVLTELMHRKKITVNRNHFSVLHALRKVDTASVLFFFGILIAISSLESTGQLTNLARSMETAIGNENVILMSIGLLSAIVDNVPLVAAAMGMYELTVYPTDDYFWEFLAYCAGTGGSALIIGSAAGVAAMGMENINFFWYMKKISLLALIGYFAGAFTFIAMQSFIS